MADLLVVIDETTKQPKCLKPIDQVGDGVINGGTVTGNTLTLTRTVGADITVDVSALVGGSASITNLGSSVDTTDPQNPVVTVTSSDGADTNFTIAIPAGSTPSITNLSHTIGGTGNTDVTIISSDGADAVIPFGDVINNFFASLPNCP